MILSPSDFVGKYELHTGIYVQSKLQNYIDIYEPMYLKHLFGIDLYNQFMSDLLNNVPQSPNFLAVFNPLSQDLGYSFYWGNSFNNVNTMIISEGIKEMLKGFIYFEYAKDLNNQMTPYGNVKPISENSEVVSTLFSMMYTRYNEAINSYRAIQRYIRYTNNPPLGQIVNLTVINGGINYLTSNGLPCVNGSGTGAVVNIVASNIGGIFAISFALPFTGGTGYSDGQYTITTGSGFNAEVYVTTNLGSVIQVDIVDPGFDYLQGDYITIPGGNDDAFFTVGNITNGGVTNAIIVDGGKNYKVGDYVNIKDGLNLTASFQVDYIGTGDYSKFRGVAKSTAYWL